MKIEEVLDELSKFQSVNMKQLEKMELSELEHYLRHLQQVQVMLEQTREKVLLRGRKDDEEQILNVKQAAQHLKVKEQTIYNYITDGRLKLIGPQGKGLVKRIKKSDLDNLK